MSLWGALSNSTLAMMAQSTALGAISENIANVNTNGFKRVETQFKTLLTETNVEGKYDVYSVKAAVTRKVDMQGMIMGSDRSNDLAINGKGLYILNDLDSGEVRYTRDGVFNTTAYDVSGDGTLDSMLVSGEGYSVMGIAADADGNFTGTTLVPIAVRDESVSAGTATTALTFNGNVSANATLTQPFSLPVYDNTFTTKNLSMQWVPDATDANVWALNFATETADGTVTAPAAGATTVTFDGNGNLPTGTTYTVPVTVTWADASTSTITVDYSGAQQLDKESRLQSMSQDGHSAGLLRSTSFDNQGVLSYSYSNGVIEPKYKIPVAVFSAPNNLLKTDGNTYAQTEESGGPTVTFANTSGGQVGFTANAYELSNVDIADEFTRMMTTQKAYSMAATVFRTGDEMVQVGRDLKR